MITSLVALLASVTSIIASDHLRVETLDHAVRNIFPDKTYSIDYVQDVKDAAVMFSISNRTDPGSDLKNFCSTLFLECEIDHAKRTIKIKKSPFLLHSNRIAKIAEALNHLRKDLEPLVRVDPKVLYSQKLNLERILQTETNELERHKLLSRISIIEAMLNTADVALMLSLLGNGSMAEILAKQCSKSNHGGITADALRYVKQYLAGEGSNQWDYHSTKDTDPRELGAIKSMANDRRLTAHSIGLQSPIPYLRHEIYAQEIQVGLFFITPDKMHGEATIDLPLGALELGTVLNISAKALAKPITVESLWGSGYLTNGSLGTMAGDLDANFASWIGPQQLWQQSGSTFAQFQTDNPGLSAKLSNGWLSIYNVNEPMGLLSKAWNQFFILREMYDARPVRRGELLAALSELSEPELDRLELLGVEFKRLPEKYSVLTSQIRLLRASLNCLATQPGNAFDHKYSYDELPKQAKKDFIGFFSSAYVWNQYADCFHPANQSKISTATLNLAYDPKAESRSHNSIQIAFTHDWDPTVNGGPMIFPLATKYMVP